MRKALHRFRTEKSGLAAVEFALLLPVMITLFFGVVEVSLALTCRSNVTSVASTTADLVAQDSQVTNADMSNVFNAANAILYPYDTGVAKITITSIVYDTVSKSLTSGKVAWSDTQGGTKKTVGTTVSLPDGLMNKDGSVIMAEISYAYSSPTTKIVTGTTTMSNIFYSKPRRVAAITRTAS